MIECLVVWVSKWVGFTSNWDRKSSPRDEQNPTYEFENGEFWQDRIMGPLPIKLQVGYRAEYWKMMKKEEIKQIEGIESSLTKPTKPYLCPLITKSSFQVWKDICIIYTHTYIFSYKWCNDSCMTSAWVIYIFSGAITSRFQALWQVS